MGLELPTIVQRFRMIVESTGNGAQSDIAAFEGHFQKAMHRSAVGITKYLSVPLAAGLGFGIDKAAKLQQSMELLHTQAGVSQANVAKQTQSLLNLAPQVATSANDLSGSLYHVESAGFHGQKALDMVNTSAKAAKIGISDIQDTTQAMIAVMASGVKGPRSMSDAMGQLNAIVGSGDMRFQDLVDAIGKTGILTEAHSLGLSLSDVGAGLATMTDNAMPAQMSATHLRMALMLMEKPSQAAQRALAGVGMNSTQMAADLRKPNGLLVALKDLKSHLSKPLSAEYQSQIARAKADFGSLSTLSGGQRTEAFNTFLTQGKTGLTSLMEHFGYTSTEASAFYDKMARGAPKLAAAAESFKAMGLSTKQVKEIIGKAGPNAIVQAQTIGEIFGGARSGSAIFTLLNELPRMQSKYTKIAQGGKKFNADWNATQATFMFKLKKFEVALETFATRAGLKVLPFLTHLLHAFEDFGHWFEHLPKGLKEFIEWGVGAAAVLAPLYLATYKLYTMFKHMKEMTSALGNGLSSLSGKFRSTGDASAASSAKTGSAAKEAAADEQAASDEQVAAQRKAAQARSDAAAKARSGYDKTGSAARTAATEEETSARKAATTTEEQDAKIEGSQASLAAKFRTHADTVAASNAKVGESAKTAATDTAAADGTIEADNVAAGASATTEAATIGTADTTIATEDAALVAKVGADDAAIEADNTAAGASRTGLMAGGLGGALGKAGFGAMALFQGYQIGTALNDQFHISDHLANILNGAGEAQVQIGYRRDAVASIISAKSSTPAQIAAAVAAIQKNDPNGPGMKALILAGQDRLVRDAMLRSASTMSAAHLQAAIGDLRSNQGTLGAAGALEAQLEAILKRKMTADATAQSQRTSQHTATTQGTAQAHSDSQSTNASISAGQQGAHTDTLSMQQATAQVGQAQHQDTTGFSDRTHSDLADLTTTVSSGLANVAAAVHRMGNPAARKGAQRALSSYGGGNMTLAQIEAELAGAGVPASAIPTLAAIAYYRESGGNPKALNYNWHGKGYGSTMPKGWSEAYGGSMDVGLFQINDKTWKDWLQFHGINWDQMNNPAVAAKAAALIYANSGFGPWGPDLPLLPSQYQPGAGSYTLPLATHPHKVTGGGAASTPETPAPTAPSSAPTIDTTTAVPSLVSSILKVLPPSALRPGPDAAGVPSTIVASINSLNSAVAAYRAGLSSSSASAVKSLASYQKSLASAEASVSTYRSDYAHATTKQLRNQYALELLNAQSRVTTYQSDIAGVGSNLNDHRFGAVVSLLKSGTSDLARLIVSERRQAYADLRTGKSKEAQALIDLIAQQQPVLRSIDSKIGLKSQEIATALQKVSSSELAIVGTASNATKAGLTAANQVAELISTLSDYALRAGVSVTSLLTEILGKNSSASKGIMAALAGSDLSSSPVGNVKPIFTNPGRSHTHLHLAPGSIVIKDARSPEQAAREVEKRLEHFVHSLDAELTSA